MTKGDLDGVCVWGRPVKPVALGASILMATLTVYNIVDAGAFADLWLGDVVAVIAGASLISLLIGWFGRSQQLAETGLLLGCAVYMARASFIIFYDGLTPEDTYLSVGAAVILGGAYLLERWDHRPKKGG